MKECKTLDRVTLVLGYECNLGCPYCPVHNLDYIESRLSLAGWSLAIEKLISCFDENIPFFLSGGEPIYNFNILKHVVSTLSKYNRKTILITNATLLDENKISELVRNKLIGLQVTFHFYYFDNVEKIRNELHRVLLLLEKYKKLSFGLTALSVNINSERDFLILEQLYKIAGEGYLNEIDILEISLLNGHLRISPSNSHLKRLKEYTEVEISNYENNDIELKEIVITPDGFVIPMETIYPMILNDRVKSRIFKNIKDSDLDEILSQENLTKFEYIVKNWKE